MPSSLTRDPGVMPQALMPGPGSLPTVVVSADRTFSMRQPARDITTVIGSTVKATHRSGGLMQESKTSRGQRSSGGFLMGGPVRISKPPRPGSGPIGMRLGCASGVPATLRGARDISSSAPTVWRRIASSGASIA